MSEFPIKKKTHRTKLRNYYNRKKRIDYTYEPPVCRPQTACVPRNAETRGNTRPKKKTARLGRFESKVGKTKYGMVESSFQPFSMGRKSSRRKSRRRKRRSPRITAAGNPDRTRVFGILGAKKYRRRKQGFVLVYGATVPRKCRV